MGHRWTAEHVDQLVVADAPTDWRGCGRRIVFRMSNPPEVGRPDGTGVRVETEGASG